MLFIGQFNVVDGPLDKILLSLILHSKRETWALNMEASTMNITAEILRVIFFFVDRRLHKN